MQVKVFFYFNVGDLASYVRKYYPEDFIPEKIIKNWLTQIAIGIYHLHNDLHIIHRDIKTMNVLVMANGQLKLADFGLAKKMNQEEDFAKSSVGTPYYLSP